jgi:hypothetical protein
LIDIHAPRSAVAPVAHALALFVTGIPVWPISWRMRWPTIPDACIRFPQYSASTSWIFTPASLSASCAASAPSSGTDFSGKRPKRIMSMPTTYTFSPMASCSFAYRVVRRAA